MSRYRLTDFSGKYRGQLERQLAREQNVLAAAALSSETGSPGKAEVRAEKEIHGLISQELHRRELRFLHADMRKKSTLPEGFPDYAIFLPGGRTVFAEVKTPEGRLAAHQAAYIKALEADGFEVWVPRSFEVFRDFLRLALEKGC